MLAALAVPVALAHVPLAAWLTSRIGDGDSPAPRRMAVSFVEVLKPQEPAPLAAPVVAPRPVPRSPRSAAAATAAASAAKAAAEQVAEVRPEPPPASTPTATTSDPPAAPPSTAAAASASPSATENGRPPAPSTTAAAPAVAAASAAAASTFEWPPSTRLSYDLVGWFRGPVEGQARVEWLQRDQRYQVHLEVMVGPSAAPLMSRRMSSEGQITEQGLVPRRYVEDTRMLLRSPRVVEVRFEPDHVVLANGSTSPRPAGTQDSASQFVQMTWLFTLQPELMQVGRRIEIPLALPRRVEPWTYEVLGRVALATPVGEIDTWHVKPRREPRPGGDLTAEIWIAPSLQNLPVRIVIRQDAETFVDLTLRQLPEQAKR